MENPSTPSLRVALLSEDSSKSLEVMRALEKQDYLIRQFRLLKRRLPSLEIKTFSPQLLIWVGPGKNLSLLRLFKEGSNGKTAPILYVQSQLSENGIASCLDAGADDFIHSPFDERILLARAQNLIRRELRNGRIDNLPRTSFESGNISLDLLSREAKLKGKVLPLTRFEFDLLAFLIKKDGKVVERKTILFEVWKYPEDVQTRTLDKHIETLRKKLKSESRRLQTVHGLGYRFPPPPPAYPHTHDQEDLCLVISAS